MAYALVQNLDTAKSSYTFRSQAQVPKSTLSLYPNWFQAQMSTHKADTKGKSVENKGKGIEKDFSKLVSQPNDTSFKVTDM